MKSKPCHNCQRRHEGCHSDCPDYADMLARNAAIHAAREREMVTRRYFKHVIENRKEHK